MLVETTTLPIELQQQILQVINAESYKASNQKPVIAQNALEYFASFDYPAEVADIEFELPPRTISNRPIPFEDE